MSFPLQRRLEIANGRLLSWWENLAPGTRLWLTRAAGLATILYVVQGLRDGGDMDLFLATGGRMLNGENPYLPPYPKDLTYAYGPMWALLLAPWSVFPYWIFNLLFNFGSLYFLYRVWNFVQGGIGWRFSALATGFLLLISMRFLLYNFSLIQLTPMLLFGCLQADGLEQKGKPWRAGAVVALLGNIKLLPLIMLGWFLLRGRWLAVMATMAFSIFFLLLPSVFVGWERNLELLGSWVEIINPTSALRTFEYDLTQHGLPSLVPSLLMDLPDKIAIRRNILELAPETVGTILKVCQLGILAIAAVRLYPWFLKGEQGQQANNAQERFLSLAIMLAVVPLVAPQQQKYAFLFAVPLLAATVAHLFASGQRRTYLLSCVAIVVWLLGSVLSDTVFLGVPLSQVTQHFKTITWATLVLVITNVAKPRLGRALSSVASQVQSL